MPVPPETVEKEEPVREKIAEPLRPVVPRRPIPRGILERMRRVDPHIAKIYRQRSGE